MMVPYRTNQGGRAPRIQNPIDITGKLHPTLYAETHPSKFTFIVICYGNEYINVNIQSTNVIL